MNDNNSESDMSSCNESSAFKGRHVNKSEFSSDSSDDSQKSDSLSSIDEVNEPQPG